MRGLQKRSIFICLTITLFALLVFTGCTKTTSKESVIKGWAAAGEPIVGAQLTILDSKGDEVWKSDEPATGDAGSFIIQVKNLPKDFRIIAEGEGFRNQTQQVLLMADYRNFNTDSDTIYINVPSTMVSAYMDRNPGTDFDEAKEAVAAILELPEWVEPGTDTHKSGTYFSYDLFLEKADDFEELNAYIDHLVASKETHLFYQEKTDGLVQSVASTIATELAKGAASYAGKELTGWALKEMGIGFEDATEAQLNQLMDKMDQISNQLDQMRSEMKYYFDQLQKQIDISSYSNRVGQIDVIGPIMSIKDDIALLATNPYQNEPYLLETLKEDIKSAIKDKILNQEYDIHNQLVGVGGQDSLLKLWSNIIKNRNEFLSYEDSLLVQRQYEYFRQLQEYILLLQVEYFHAIGEEGDNIPRIEAALATYENNITEQQKLLLKPIPEGLVICIYKDDHGWMFAKPVKLYPMKENISELAASYHYDKYLGYDKWVHIQSERFNFVGKLLENCGGSSETFSQRLLLRGWGEKNIIPEMDRFAVTYKEAAKLDIGYYQPESVVYSRFSFSDGQWYKHYVTTSEFNESKALKESDWFTFFIYRDFSAEELAEYFWLSPS